MKHLNVAEPTWPELCMVQLEALKERVDSGSLSVAEIRDFHERSRAIAISVSCVCDLLVSRVKDGQDRADEIQAFNHLASSIENLLLKKGVPRDQASELFQDFSDGLNITRWDEMNMEQLLYAEQMYTSTMGHDNANTSRVKGHILNMVKNKGW